MNGYCISSLEKLKTSPINICQSTQDTITSELELQSRNQNCHSDITIPDPSCITFSRRNEVKTGIRFFADDQPINPFLSMLTGRNHPSKYDRLDTRVITKVNPKEKPSLPTLFKKSGHDPIKTKFDAKVDLLSRHIHFTNPKIYQNHLNIVSEQKPMNLSNFNLIAFNRPIKKIHTRPNEPLPRRISFVSKRKTAEFKIYYKEEYCLKNLSKYSGLLQPVSRDNDYDTEDSELDTVTKKVCNDLYDGLMITKRKEKVNRSVSSELVRTVRKIRNVSMVVSLSCYV